MRAFAVLILLAGAARADTTPPGARETPKPGTADWRAMTTAIAAYCDRHPSQTCREALDDLRGDTVHVLVAWNDDVLEVNTSFDDHGSTEARLRRRRNGWRVLSIKVLSIPHEAPKFD